jgi:hypothetical protein
MAVGRDERMANLRPRLEAEFGARGSIRAVQVLALTEMAWHDSTGEPSPPVDVIDDILVVADGDVERLIEAALLAVMDFRDLRVAANERRRG